MSRIKKVAILFVIVGVATVISEWWVNPRKDRVTHAVGALEAQRHMTSRRPMLTKDECAALIAEIRLLERSGRSAEPGGACQARMADDWQKARAILGWLDNRPISGCTGILQNAASSLLACTNCSANRSSSCDAVKKAMMDAEEENAAKGPKG